MTTFSKLLLDCDGVIVNSEELAETAELSVLAEFGLELSEREYRDLVLGSVSSVYIDEIRQRIHDVTGVWEPEDRLTRRLQKARWAAYESDLKLIDGMEKILTRFRRNLAIVSSSNAASVERKLALAGVKDASGISIVSMESQGQSKDQAYLSAAISLQTSTSLCLAVEDSPAGVLAARNAGITVWALTLRDYPTREQLSRAGASRIMTSGSELENELGPALTR